MGKLRNAEWGPMGVNRLLLNFSDLRPGPGARDTALSLAYME